MTIFLRPLMLIVLPSFIGVMARGLSPQRSILVTGANKGQGFALCERILSEHADTHVFLCSRDSQKGQHAASQLASSFSPDRVDLIQLDVTNEQSVLEACSQVEKKLSGTRKLFGVASNAGILWDHTLEELIDVCAIGVQRVLDGFLPLMENGGRVIVVSSGLGPLMHGYSSQERKDAMTSPDCTWKDLQRMMGECLDVADTSPEQFEKIGFPGGPFAEAAPDFHMYGLAKMFADAYMLSLTRKFPNLHINSCDPGLVFTDLIGKMPRYEGKAFEETGAKTPADGVEAAMRLLFGASQDGVVLEENGRFYAMSKDRTELLHSGIDKMPNK
jgi:NAD(P)-dependent dehydrogenase (short-subunit alcohol dehydrogenase family)